MRPVLDGVNFHVQRGDVTCMVGGSGCGKSTLLKSIIGLVTPRSGTIDLLGHDVLSMEPEEREPLLRRVGVMFQYGALLNSLTVGENVALPIQMHTNLETSLITELVRTRLHLVGLDDTENLMPTELSGGMRKRAALARAMSLEPEILFCDEPGAGLDPITAAGIDQLLMSLNRNLGTTVVVVTHELLSIERLDGGLLMLDGGRVAYSGTAREAREAGGAGLREFFHPG
ncbi:MAG: ATP-binding cassette domain-containing protein [Candidatus Latescibacterota bacterium]|nr:ATP-binding cassette domain-containing protein [Candidatus Latescibacterota bacterium]